MIEMFLQKDNFLVYLPVNEDDNAIRNSATKHWDIDSKKEMSVVEVAWKLTTISIDGFVFAICNRINMGKFIIM